MNRNLTLWIVSAVFVVLLPMGIVSLSTSSQPAEVSTKTDVATDPPKTKQSASMAPTGIDVAEEASSPSIEKVVAPTVVHLEPASEFAEAAALGGASSPETSADKPSKEEDSEESPMPAMAAGVDYFGGGTDSLVGEDLDATVLGDEPEAKGPPQVIADAEDRLAITVIRPKKNLVLPQDEIIGRCRDKAATGYAITLVKSAQVGASWWVQESLPRKWTYFRAKARFGNAKTEDGSRFKVVVAFLPDDVDIPDTGTQYREIPKEFRLSQELEFTLRRR